MANNVNFNDVLYSTAMKNATTETTLLTLAIVNANTELSLLSECMDNFAKGSGADLASAFTSIASVGTVAKTALSGVSDAVSAYKTFGEGVKVLGELAKAHEKQEIAIKSVNIVEGIKTALTNLGTIAQTALNTAMSLFPAALVIAGIVAIVAVFAIFIKNLNKASEEQKRLNAETAELKKKNEELTKSMKDSEDTYKNNTDKMALQAGTAEKLAEKVFELSEKENKSAEEKQQLALMVDELNEAMPGLNLLYDEEADLLNKSSDAVYGLIAAKKEELLQEAMAERAVELLKEQLELEYQREAVDKKIEEWENATDVKHGAWKKEARRRTHNIWASKGVRSAA